MFELLFGFFLFTFVFSLAKRKRNDSGRLLLPGQVDENFRQALRSGDNGTLIRYYRLALSRQLPVKDEQLIRINLAHALTALGDYNNALEEIDKVSLSELTPTQVALWLNNRAYILAQMGQFDDALDNLKDAEDLLTGHEMVGKEMILIACLNGTRGLALLKKGDLDAAEKALELALKLDQTGPVEQFGTLYNAQDASRTAERWLLLSEISKQRGNMEEMKKRLKRAAYHPLTEPGTKAIAALKKIN